MPEALRICVIGSGSMGRIHAEAWQAREDASVVAVCALRPARREQLAKDFGTKPYADYREAITQENANVVSICVPTYLHREIACFAAEHSCHILCEKPIALTLDDADVMIKAAEANNVLLAIASQCRDFTSNKKFKQMIADGVFGGPVLVSFIDVREVRPKIAMHRRSMNGGPVIDMANHYFDLIRFLTGCEPISVSAAGDVFGKGKVSLKEVDDLAIDAATITVRMEGGHVLRALLNWGMPEGFPSYSLQYLVGSAISARVTGEQFKIQYSDHKETWKNHLPTPGSKARIDNLAEAIHCRAEVEISGQDGRRALGMSLAALESIETGKTVML